MKPAIALLAAALVVACSAEPESTGNEAMDQLGGTENLVSNAMENEVVVNSLGADSANEDSEAAGSAPAKSEVPSTLPSSSRSAVDPLVKPSPPPPAREQASPPAAPPPAPAPSPTPKAACTPEHAAMGHCRL